MNLFVLVKLLLLFNIYEVAYYSMGDEGIVKINSNNMCNFNIKKGR